MKVLTLQAPAGVINRSDIQIQSSVAKIGIEIALDNAIAGVPVHDVTVRLRHISSKGGTKVLIEKMPLLTLLEISAAGEGFFQYSPHKLEGSIDITPDGKALDISGGYLSLDIDSGGHSANFLDICTIDSPLLTNEVVYYNPVLINGGITKDINLAGVESIAIGNAMAESIQFDYPGRTVTMTDSELAYTCQILNDIVCVQDIIFNDGDGLSSTFKVAYGFFEQFVFPTRDISRMTVTPNGNQSFYVYLVEKRTV